MSSGVQGGTGTCQPHGCCPSTWNMYGCAEVDGGAGLNCHNPALGCPSSMTCGGGCDSEVTGACTACADFPCPLGQQYDSTQCACVPTVCSTAADCNGPLPALCQRCVDGGYDASLGCAHWSCLSGTCVESFCE
jgi:hypothetical protein